MNFDVSLKVAFVVEILGAQPTFEWLLTLTLLALCFCLTIVVFIFPGEIVVKPIIQYFLFTFIFYTFTFISIQWKLDLAGTDLAENLVLKDTLQKIWGTVFDF